MAAVSAPQAPTALTPPSSSHGGQNSWNYSVPARTETSPQKTNEVNKPPSSHLNGNPLSHSNSRTNLSQRSNTYNPTQSTDSGYLAPARVNALNRKDSSISETGSAPDSLLDLYGTNRSGLNSIDYGDRKIMNGDAYDDEDDPEHSRWIHRDKLARIESQELQAAGIILPRARAPSKSSRREQSRDQQGNGVRSEQAQKRQRVGSIPTEEEEAPENNAWDLRTPEEVADDEGDMFRDVSGGVKGVSRIPVLKTSPLPIPLQHLERDTPMKRKLSGGNIGEDDSITYPKSRGRSQSIKVLEDANATPTPAKRLGSENSPTKKTPRKASTPGTRGPSGQQRSKTRSGQARDASGNQRPTTRSGELGKSNSISKSPEGDPPWLASMYKPDPRLPPDQQLLPTVARRLQQEQWEKEGKFGNVYDRSFRPLNDDEYPRSPEPPIQPSETQEKQPEEEHGAEWPLRGAKSPALSTGRPGTAGGQGSYSTMPKITGSPQGVGPIQSPKPPIRVPDPPEDTKKGGCGCCVIM
ncbi:uncharacterized protein PAC_18335 [Phialocephala subalpina]|uniref:TeaA receptor TeaR n=1 Tax=Phialocephala subalpina TaxID=576137 RepID=A0A1L7XTT1_9HELO|nr:uncharacterized protein PAC_18335 [Phialocephala subalpina]